MLDSAPDSASSLTLETFCADVAGRAYRFAEAGLRHREDAQDVVQDAMRKLLAYRDRPYEEWTPLFWRILRTGIIDTQRRRKFRLRWLFSSHDDAQDSISQWADDAPNPERQQENRQAWELLSAALQKLPNRQREAFTLRVLEEFDVAQTAAIMQCSEGSVKTHLSRARARLQQTLGDWK